MESIEDVTTAEWDGKVLKSDVPVAVDFWHENCSWCRKLDPEYAATAEDFAGKMRFTKVHVFRERDIAMRYGIQGTPTIKFFCNGREVHEIVGFRPRPALKREIESLMERYKECLDQSTPVA